MAQQFSLRCPCAGFILCDPHIGAAFRETDRDAQRMETRSRAGEVAFEQGLPDVERDDPASF